MIQISHIYTSKFSVVDYTTVILGYENQFKYYVLLTLVHEVFEMSGSCLYQILCCLYVPCECCTVAPSHKGHLRIQQDATH
jgi:hypothetical protein